MSNIPGGNGTNSLDGLLPSKLRYKNVDQKGIGVLAFDDSTLVAATSIDPVTKQTVLTVSAPGVAASMNGTVGNAVALVTNGVGNVVTATLAALATGFAIAGIAAAASVAGKVTVFHHGPVPASIFSLGSGTACRAGFNSLGQVVRCSDIGCISKLQFVGWVDASGALYVAPHKADYFNVVDFGADPTGTNLNDAAFATVAALATGGDRIFLPQGKYRIANTWGPFSHGVTIEGPSIGFDPDYVNLTGAVILYEGLGDGVRLGTDLATGRRTIENLTVRCTNAANVAPCRTAPVQQRGGGVAGTSSSSGLVEIATTSAHRLATGNLVQIDNIVGTTEANGAWAVTVIDSTHFTIPVSFSHAYVSGGTVTMTAGAGIVSIGGGNELIRNCYVSGFAIGILFDGSEIFRAENCWCEGPNRTLANNKLFTCGIWAANGKAARGFNIEGNTNFGQIINCSFAGSSTGFFSDGMSGSVLIQGCFQNLPEAQIRVVNGISSHVGDGLVEIDTFAPHGLANGDYVGISGVLGTTEANGEFQVTVVDSTHFTIPVSFVHAWAPHDLGLTITNVAAGAASVIEVTTSGPHGLVWGQHIVISGVVGATIANGSWNAIPIDATHFYLADYTDNPTTPFSGPAYVSGGAVKFGGQVASNAPCTFAWVNRLVSVTFDNSYSEGYGDAHFLFQSPSFSDAGLQSAQVVISNHSALGPCPGIAIIGTTIKGLLLLNNVWDTLPVLGAGQLEGSLVRLGNLWEPYGGSFGVQSFFDVPPTNTQGIVCDIDNTATSGAPNGTIGTPNAHWDVQLNDYAIAMLRCGDMAAFNDWLTFWVNSVGSTDLRRHIQTAGGGNVAGEEDSLRTALLATYVSGAATVIATSVTLPPHAHGFFRITVTAHRDDDTQAKGATWVLRGSWDQNAAGTVVVQDGPSLEYSYIGDTGAYPGTSIGGVPSPTVTASGSTLQVSAKGNTNDASTWVVRIETTTSQRAR